MWQAVRRSIVVALLGLVAVAVVELCRGLVAPVSGVVPNLVVVLVVFLAFHQASPMGAFLAFVCGLFVDVATSLVIGPWAAGFVAVFGTIAALSTRVFVEAPIAIGVLCAVATVIANTICGGLTVNEVPDVLLMARDILLEALATGLVAPALFPLLRRVLESGRRRRTRTLALS